jgi:hypothetical protein
MFSAGSVEAGRLGKMSLTPRCSADDQEYVMDAIR